MAEGLRVMRGPGWVLGEGDGGEGHVGTLVEVGANGTVNVTWDSGLVTTCGATINQVHELRVLDNAPVGIRHFGVVCDDCHESNIVGVRWKCSDCPDFDLCSFCYFTDKHNLNHRFLRIETPKSERALQEQRSKSMKMRVLGIFPDATVVRGMDWQWGDQDGGKGCTGRVTELITPSDDSARSTVGVEWENGGKNIYRLGHRGKVDLQYTEEAPGLECYPQHLPLLDVNQYKNNDAVNANPVSEEISEGDSVTITMTAEQLENVQKTRSGWAFGMAECIGQVGKVLGFAPNGDAIVSYGKKKYRLFTGALKKMTNRPITVGSKVRILNDEDKVKMYQEGHGGYNQRMRNCLGKVGKVIKVDEDGDIAVRFGAQRWVFSPLCCVPDPEAAVDEVDSDEEFKLSDMSDMLKTVLGGQQGGDGSLLGLLSSLAQNVMSAQLKDVVFFKAIADKDEKQALDLLEKKPELAKEEVQGITTLHIAANRGLLRLSTALVEAGADLSSKDRDGDTPLLSALAGGAKDVAVLLIQKGCDVFKSNKDGQTAAHKAALFGFTQVLQALIAAGADLNAQDDNRDTPLHDSITQKEPMAAEVILTWPPLDLHRANRKGHPPLHFACLRNETKIIDLIVERDKSVVDTKKEDGYTPIHVCAFNNHSEAMEILLRKGGAKVNLLNNENQSALHLAVHEGAFDCVKLLVQHGADVTSRDNEGNTVLHVAMRSFSQRDERVLLHVLSGRIVTDDKRTEIARFLLEHGADPEAENDVGLRAIDACPSSHQYVKDDLRKFIANGCSSMDADVFPSPSKKCKPASVDDEKDNTCQRCNGKKAEILLVPCGHRVVCKSCCQKISLCPQCKTPVKEMFDEDGSSVKGCRVM